MNTKDFSNDWKWQIANRIHTQEQLAEHITLSEKERAAFEGEIPLSFAVTPYYTTLLNSSALRKTVIPTDAENHVGTGELADPLGEEDHRATPHLIHTYPDKVLFLATTFCSTYCRYCTRSRIVGKPLTFDVSTFEETFQYIEQHTEIRDVLLSGGDPLTMTDSVLDELLSRIRSIPHVKMVRIGSKVPVVLPMRITDELCSLLRKHRVWLSLHFIHADELTEETQQACRKLADHGIGMVSQTVLLKGINDNTPALIDLFYGLLEINVKPYYLLQCDPVHGSRHFRTSVEKGIELIQSLHGSICGLAVPQYVIDAPGGGGKVPILGKEQIRRDGDDVVFLNYLGKEYRYPDPLI
ncbi:KamA family radical SAM protein [Pontiellaceae bacterium B12227]|nr:KamA family radical SAM protein [Pontiellaceae bacterium B12227]